jgi:tetratricopeptide (TPR) repeat protein
MKRLHPNLICSSLRKETPILEPKASRVSLRRLLQPCALPLLILTLAGFFPLHVRASTEGTAAAFDTANKLYEQGKFTNAAAAYQQLLQSGQASPALYFNLGNAYFKNGQMGRAIAAYRQAELITPRDPDVRANLQFARNQIQGPTISTPGWQHWLSELSLNEWTCIAAAALWVWFGVLIIVQWRPALKGALRKSSVVLGVIAVLLNACLLTVLGVDRFSKTAVVVASEATVRQGPLDESQTAFNVHDGAELQVLDHKDEWLQVTTDPRRIGWLRRDQVILTPQS